MSFPTRRAVSLCAIHSDHEISGEDEARRVEHHEQNSRIDYESERSLVARSSDGACEKRRAVPHVSINTSGSSGYESRVPALDRPAPFAVGTSHAWGCPSFDEATAYAGGASAMLAVAQPLRNERRVTAWRGGRDRISHTRFDLARHGRAGR